ncbi:short-chain dehydrogenase [Xylariaceae sp. FL0594]|nr:short-chain dehydrogenase [Xylariaceae sp. FL0594]
MGAQWSQFFPPKPTFTESSVPCLEGKVFFITGGASGIGYELAKMLYRKRGRVYMAGRSESKVLKAIAEITKQNGGEGGSIEFLHLELDDLASIKASAEAFMAKESKLHVLWNNAGVSRPPAGSVSKQGIELQLATNCLGPFLFMQFLLPVLQYQQASSTPSEEPPSRVIWTASQAMELSAPKGGLEMSEVRSTVTNSRAADTTRLYVNSKTGNLFLAIELARRCPGTLVSVSLNPGAATTDLFRHTPSVRYLAWPLLHRPEHAALTELYAGLSPDVNLDATNGCYIVPWGAISTRLRLDLVAATRSREEGGTGRAQEFWDFCVEMTKDYQ